MKKINANWFKITTLMLGLFLMLFVILIICWKVNDVYSWYIVAIATIIWLFISNKQHRETILRYEEENRIKTIETSFSSPYWVKDSITQCTVIKNEKWEECYLFISYNHSDNQHPRYKIFTKNFWEIRYSKKFDNIYSIFKEIISMWYTIRQ